MHFFIRVACCWLVSVGALAQVRAAEPLPALAADAEGTTVSGLSAGGFMAMQYQVAFSASVRGAGIVAGGPYYCVANLGADPNIVSLCMGKLASMGPSAGLLLTAARGFATKREIDPLGHLRRARIYLFSGRHDEVVQSRIVDASAEFFRIAGVPHSALKYETRLDAGHAFIAPGVGNDCSANAPPFISHCRMPTGDYDQAAVLLHHLYGKLRSPAANLSSSVMEFDQKEFAGAEAGLAGSAYVYIPAACRRGGCRVHVVFHGCLQSAAQVGDQFYTLTGYNRWADTNRLIVLYPQVAGETRPNSCWDWIGYTGENYATQTAPQMQAVREMLGRLQSSP